MLLPLLEKMEELLNKKYQIIYADPPRSRKTYSDKWRKKTPDNHYDLMDIEDIKNMPIWNISDTDCILAMRTQDAHLKNAISIWEERGFEYKTILFVRDKQNFWLWYWTRKWAEICLLFTKWHPKRVSASVRQFISEKSKVHSKKPDDVRDRIVQLMWDLPRIELFARQQTEWRDVFWNEVENSIKLD